MEMEDPSSADSQWDRQHAFHAPLDGPGTPVYYPSLTDLNDLSSSSSCSISRLRSTVTARDAKPHGTVWYGVVPYRTVPYGITCEGERQTHRDGETERLT